jgi:8-oxo-dGTP pyrophosphatase MutT (NUDIX family)
MPEFATDSGRFNLRVVGVCVQHEHVLLHREDADDFWVLPGGRALLNEPTRDTLVREMKEEMGRQVEVGRLLWLVENFFTWRGADIHELALYYEMVFRADPAWPATLEDFTGKEGVITLHFRWFPLAEIERVRIKPAFLQTALRTLPGTTVHLVHADSGT